MHIEGLHSQREIESFVRKNPLIHLYEIGDLDDFFWPKTIWYALKDRDEIRQLALVYIGTSLPVMHAHADPPEAEMDQLIAQILPYLPVRFYAHMGERSVALIAQHYSVASRGLYLKMGLRNPAKLERVETSHVINLKESDVDALKSFYAVSYPGNWFDPRMLQTGFYFGVRAGGQLASVSGIHVVSQQYGVAALGNVATHPEFRGKGFATAACAKLCSELLTRGISAIGLNVKAENQSAIACYQKLGFEPVMNYGEYMCEKA